MPKLCILKSRAIWSAEKFYFPFIFVLKKSRLLILFLSYNGSKESPWF